MYDLTEAEKAVIQKYLNGEIGAFTISEEDMTTMNEVIKKAEAAAQSKNEDFGSDLIRWFYEKCQEAEADGNI